MPALQNAPLLTIHVGMAVISYGIFATSFAAGVGYLVQGQGDRFAWLPSHKVLDEVAYRAVIIGFPLFATMIILGSWWASIAWSTWRGGSSSTGTPDSRKASDIESLFTSPAYKEQFQTFFYSMLLNHREPGHGIKAGLFRLREAIA